VKALDRPRRAACWSKDGLALAARATASCARAIGAAAAPSHARCTSQPGGPALAPHPSPAAPEARTCTVPASTVTSVFSPEVSRTSNFRAGPRRTTPAGVSTTNSREESFDTLNHASPRAENQTAARPRRETYCERGLGIKFHTGTVFPTRNSLRLPRSWSQVSPRPAGQQCDERNDCQPRLPAAPKTICQRRARQLVAPPPKPSCASSLAESSQ